MEAIKEGDAMTNDPDPMLEDDMRAWLRTLNEHLVPDLAERERLNQEIDKTIAILDGVEEEDRYGPIIVNGRDHMWECSVCRAEIDPELVKHYDYQIDRGGVQPGTENGPAVYWNEGTITCPGCGARLPYSESSD